MRFVLPAVARLVAVLYRSYYATLRLRVNKSHGGDMTHPSEHVYDSEIFAVCERDALALGGWIAGRRFATLVAPGRDGDWAAALLEAIGCRVVRGATARGGRNAVQTLCRVLRTTSEPLGLVVDGPLGPSGVARRGAIVCAHRTRRPVHAVAAAAAREFTFPRTWSGIYLPLPFSRVEITIRELHMKAALPFDSAGLATELTRHLADARAASFARIEARE
jgi:lysophospholipid acyltransferase (LPLAT)-like uncharacterized protein